MRELSEMRTTRRRRLRARAQQGSEFAQATLVRHGLGMYEDNERSGSERSGSESD